MEIKNLLKEAVPASELKDNYRIRALLVGPSKGGKTTSSILTWPDSFKKLEVDMDGRSQTLAGAPNTDIIQVVRTPDQQDAWSNLNRLKEDLWELASKGSFPYDVVIYEGLSSMRHIVMDHCMQLHGQDGKLLQRIAGTVPTLAHVQPHIHETSKFIFNQLALPCHVVFTGHFYTYEDEHTKRIEYWPSVLGTTMRNELGTWFDEVYHCYGSPDKEGMKYYWQTLPDRRLTFLGSTLNKEQKFWKDPIEINLKEKPTGFEKLLKLRFGERR